MKKPVHPAWRHVRDALLIFAASGLFALSINWFTAPNNIAPGGASGLATAINYATGFPIGVGILLINLPLFVLGMRMLGWRFLIRTGVATVVSSVAVDALSFVPALTDDALLAAIFGGALTGVALGLIFMAGATTGGSDLAGRMLHEKLPHMSMGRLILIIDAAVVAVAAVVFRDINSMFYSAITIFICSSVIDKILNGMDTAKALYIITDRHDDIAQAICSSVGRGVTLLRAVGSYTGAERMVIMCVVKPYEVAEVKRIVLEADERAFVILADVSEVMGEGFKPYSPQQNGKGKAKKKLQNPLQSDGK